MRPWCKHTFRQMKKREKERKFNSKNTASSSKQYYLLEYLDFLLIINNHIVGLGHKNRIIRTCLMYHAVARLSFNHSSGRTHSRRFPTLLYILRIVMLLLFSATWGGGSTRVIQEPRHRPLLLVYYRTGSSHTRRLAGAQTRSLWRPRPSMVANH